MVGTNRRTHPTVHSINRSTVKTIAQPDLSPEAHRQSAQILLPPQTSARQRGVGWVGVPSCPPQKVYHRCGGYGARVIGLRQTALIQDPFKTIPQSTGISLHAFSCVFFVYNALSLRPTEGGSIKASTMSLKLHNLRLLASIQKWGFRPRPGKPKQQEDRFDLCHLLFFLRHVIVGHLLFYKAVKIRMHSRERKCLQLTPINFPCNGGSFAI